MGQGGERVEELQRGMRKFWRMMDVFMIVVMFAGVIYNKNLSNCKKQSQGGREAEAHVLY